MHLFSASGDMGNIALLLVMGIILIPILGSFVVFFIGRYSEKLRDAAAIAITGVTFFSALVLFLRVFNSGEPLELMAFPVGFLEPFFLLKVDFLSCIIILIASFIWFMATLFSKIYMDHEHEKNRYYLFYLISLGSCLGVFMAGDFLTLFLFFEIMTFASYVLVIHAQSKEAMEAGNNYIFLGVGGGLALLAGLFLLFFNTGTVSFQPAAEVLSNMGDLRYLLAFLMIAGFGVKAGMFPLHIWLPQAHPVAPAPASALLSGLMIKTGAYGIIRVLNMLFAPSDPVVKESWSTSAELGYIIIWIGIVTMFMAAFLALFQTNAKRILAYSSVSQMGYILMGLGVAAYIGYEEGAMGLSGAFYHIVNHAFFKASMFMIVGAIYVRTHELNLNLLGGMRKRFPLMTVSFLIAAAGITGVPGLNGYTSKTVLHHAIEDAFKYTGEMPLFVAERIFTVTSIFTVCYITKLFYGLFIAQAKGAPLKTLQKETGIEKIVFSLFSLVIIALGIFPNFFMNNYFLTAAGSFSFYTGKIEYLTKLNFWATPDLVAIGQVLALGLLLFLVAGKKLNQITLPGFISIEYLIYRPFIRITGIIYTFICRLIDTGTDTSYTRSPYLVSYFSRLSNSVETGVEKSYINSTYAVRLLTMSGNVMERAAEKLIVGYLEPLKKISTEFGKFEITGLVRLGMLISRSAIAVRDFFGDLWERFHGYALSHILRILRNGFKLLITMDYRPKGNRFFETVNMSSLDVSLFIMFIMLVVIMGLWFVMP